MDESIIPEEDVGIKKNPMNFARPSITLRGLDHSKLALRLNLLRVSTASVCLFHTSQYAAYHTIGIMASRANTPYAAQDTHEISTLVKGLEACSKNGPGKKTGVHGKKNSFEIAGTKGVTVDSWRFQDWDYKRRDLPTYARGLFTYNRKDGTPEIVCRGYDKFFNQGEVHETKLENVEKQARGPYELSVKENGCIIFIGGLEGDHLLVCSKHSTGDRQDTDVSHAKAGEKWVDRHLQEIGKTRMDLARELRKRNVTAVAELCDDSFEEHVLAYDERTAGLYLHGMNLNLPEFATYSGELVQQFAKEWNLKSAEYLMKEDIASMQTFLQECAETGSYHGRDTEGFVIRCQRKEHGVQGNYQDWFFKYKFEEPYLMYRQWRECTKAVIGGKPPKFKKHKQITQEYLLYARRQLAKDPKLGKAYMQNHGIIAMRENFLKERGLKGSDIIRQEMHDSGGSSTEVTKNVVLVPIASIGCGKTTVAVALTKLFGWGHVQNDNITGTKGRPKQFATLICNTLAGHPAMIADRNNHQKRERQQIIDDVLAVIPDAKFVALHYVHDPKSEMLPSIRQVTQDRVLSRGDNHQTIQAGSKSRKDIIGIMEGFLERFETLDIFSKPDDAFDEVIDLDVAADSRTNLETVVKALHSAYPKLVPELPGLDDLDVAIESALNDYKPDIKHDLSFKSKKANQRHNKQANSSADQTHQNGTGATPNKPRPLEYFCVRLPTVDVLSTLNPLFDSLPNEQAAFYRQLGHSRRIQPTFHVTLIHRASKDSHPDLWTRLSNLYSTATSTSPATENQALDPPVLGQCRVQLERVVWDRRVMCIVARLLDEGWETVNALAHVTVGTAGQDIKPKESNDLLRKWLEVGSGGETGIGEVQIPGCKVVFGQVKAVLSNSGR